VERELHGKVTRWPDFPAGDRCGISTSRCTEGWVPLHARSERQRAILMPHRIADEVVIHDLLGPRELPVLLRKI
jgi:hypothetical protein